MGDSIDRTGFLRKIFLLDGGLDAVRSLRGQDEPGHRSQPSFSIPFTFLRPPGAPLEPQFLKHCTRCDLCADACPEHIIIKAEDELMGEGTPIIDPSVAPCTMCDKCIEACPDEALLPDEDRRMGRAVWDAETCLSRDSIECTRCVESCPLGESAIEAVAGTGIVIHPETCTGCAFCFHACPTDPRSIHLEGRPPVPLRGHPPVPERHE